MIKKMRIRQKRHPHWLKVPMPGGNEFSTVRKLIQQNRLHTVCQSAHCPNIGECWGQRTATFMILGNICTRNCSFCNIPVGKPAAVDADEPERVAEAVKTLELRYAVITSVTRDDLPDGGASIFAETIKQIRNKVPDCRVEVLIPDFGGSLEALMKVIRMSPDVLNHNIETVPRLYSVVRPSANYQRSINVLDQAKKFGLLSKSGLMLGLGETEHELTCVLQDLRKADCDFLTLGQYLQPSAAHFAINRYVPPEEFESIKHKAIKMGFRAVEAGPLVRSSYHAAASFEKNVIKRYEDFQ
ncbi:MAG TPA: lipoyl synthase [bacterium]|nr:lipoyl synthase [bacterium]